MRVSYSASRRPPEFVRGPHRVELAAPATSGRPIGSYLREARQLTEAQLEQIVVHQRQLGVRFGEAAVALDLVTRDDVLWALSRQFDYVYTRVDDELSPELVAATRPFGSEAETFREIRSQLLAGALGAEGSERRALAIVSPDRGDGRSYLAANLAVTLGQLGGRTLLVDADLRVPRLHRLFDIDPVHGGLSDMLTGRADGAAMLRVGRLAGLWLLCAGTVPPNPLELVQRSSFAELARELQQKFDHVVFDTPAATHGADARVVAAACGIALVVGRKGRSRMHDLAKLAKGFSRTLAVAGLVMNEH
jgi:chain length determinant protein tyrosine kinase EpsG